jgi:L-alanine-DL-glutamate epimerase-like enolase superfamily enzyme
VKITDLKVHMLSTPIPSERQHRTDLGQAVKGEAAVVEVGTDEGLTGIGPAYGPPPVIRAVVEAELKPLALGQDPCAVEGLWERMYAGSRAALSAATGYTFPRVHRRGETLAAMSGIDVACWDIAGQAAGLPVYRLLGGGIRNRIPGYASGGWRSADGIAEEVGGYVARGFQAVKMRVWGEHDFLVREAAATIEAARAALGDSVDLMVDAHGALGLPDATTLAERIAPCRIRWFEEPVSPDDHAGYRHLRSRTRIPLAAGENEVTRYPFVSLLADGSLDILQPDVAVVGGITESRRIAILAHAHHRIFTPHVWHSGLIVAASLQLAAAAPNCPIFEVPMSRNPLIWELMTPSFEVRDGWIAVPGGPGLGVSLVRDAEQRFPYLPGPMYA